MLPVHIRLYFRSSQLVSYLDDDVSFAWCNSIQRQHSKELTPTGNEVKTTSTTVCWIGEEYIGREETDAISMCDISAAIITESLSTHI